ncbi:hypothetical protein CI102_7905 [Trichoderma harzianum]|nr:hypothetical protein CI102_7905 [Trichoderma harzianum]
MINVQLLLSFPAGCLRFSCANGRRCFDRVGVCAVGLLIGSFDKVPVHPMEGKSTCEYSAHLPSNFNHPGINGFKHPTTLVS